MARIRWYLKRLRVMTAAEILYRVSQQVTMVRLRAQYRRSSGVAGAGADPAQLAFCSGSEPRLPPLSFDRAAVERKKGALLAGTIPVAGSIWTFDDSDDTWHRAPDNGRTWPRGFFGNIAYREGNPTGDVRQLWEPARLQQLVDLALVAQSGSAGERAQAAKLALAQLLSWVKQNPPLAGPHYISAMECALRLIAACHALDLLRPRMGDDTPWRALAAIISSHAPLIEQRLSLHSSTGNHTVAEAAGLVYAGLLFPEMKGARRWLQKGMLLLSQMAESQVLADGGGVEQALWYHLFNVKLLTLVTKVMEHYDEPVPESISSAALRGSRFLAVMGVGDGWVPPIGDADGGYALSSLLQLSEGSGEEAPQTCTFRQSGYTVAQVGRRASLIFDHGPLGMPPAYGHGHADALSLLLRIDGEDILVDPGTYTYTGDQDWRRYFRSTRAHNTVTVAGRDQATQEGCFLWSNPFEARLVDAKIDGSEGGRVVAVHDGYRHLGVHHVRGIAWMRDQWLVVWDQLSGEGAHAMELHWHLAGDLQWPEANRLEIPTAAGSALGIRLTGGTVSTHKGQRTPIAGWRSPSYGKIEPVTAVKISAHGPLPHEFTTFITLPGGLLRENEAADALQWIKSRAS